jgi:hypothetical protein
MVTKDITAEELLIITEDESSNIEKIQIEQKTEDNNDLITF